MVLPVLDAHTWDEVQNGKWRSLKMSSSVLQVFKGLQRHQSLWQQLQVIWNSVFILTGWLYFGNNQPWNLSDLTQWKLISLSHTHKLCFFFICGVFSTAIQAIHFMFLPSHHEALLFAVAKEGNMENWVPALERFHPESHTTLYSHFMDKSKLPNNMELLQSKEVSFSYGTKKY